MENHEGTPITSAPRDTTCLLENLKNLPKDHPDYLPTYLEIAVYASQDEFYKACRVLAFATPDQIDELSIELCDMYSNRMFDEIELIEKKPDLSAWDVIQHLLYARTLAYLSPNDIDPAIDYLVDFSYYLGKTAGKNSEIFLDFVNQFAGDDIDQQEETYSILEFDDQHKAIGYIDHITDAFTIALIFEVQFLVDMYNGDPRIHELYETAAYLFSSFGCKSIAEDFLRRASKGMMLPSEIQLRTMSAADFENLIPEGSA